MPNKQFFAGLEEALARLVGLVLTLTFFLIYTWAVDGINLNWLQAFFAFGLFWLVYEAVAFGLFILFDFFARFARKTEPERNSQIQTSHGDYIPIDTTNTSENANDSNSSDGGGND